MRSPSLLPDPLKHCFSLPPSVGTQPAISKRVRLCSSQTAHTQQWMWHQEGWDGVARSPQFTGLSSLQPSAETQLSWRAVCGKGCVTARGLQDVPPLSTAVVSIVPRTRWGYWEHFRNKKEKARGLEMWPMEKLPWSAEHCTSSTEHSLIESSCFGPAWPEPEQAISRYEGLWGFMLCCHATDGSGGAVWWSVPWRTVTLQ